MDWKWLSGETKITLFSSFGTRVQELGTGFMVSKQVRHLIVGFNVTPIVYIFIREKSYPHILTETSVHKDKEQFNDKLGREYND